MSDGKRIVAPCWSMPRQHHSAADGLGGRHLAMGSHEGLCYEVSRQGTPSPGARRYAIRAALGGHWAAYRLWKQRGIHPIPQQK